MNSVKCKIRVIGTNDVLCQFQNTETIMTWHGPGNECYRTIFEIERAKRLVDFIENTEPNFDTFNSKMSGEFLVNVYTHNELKEKGVSIEIIEETLF